MSGNQFISVLGCCTLCVIAPLVVAGAGCSDQSSLDRAALLDPASCQSCHPAHYREWASSMHAYASDDPIFLALNALAQEETNGAAGAFCVGCHAPMAVREGATKDGLNLADVPRSLKGVTCHFCHSVDQVLGLHNNALSLATDNVLRGAMGDTVATEAHTSTYSALQDSARLESSKMCGSCHDVVTPTGLALENTFAEWQESVFSQPGPGGLSCNGCHMPTRRARAAEVPGAPERLVHEHAWPGVDLALATWPDVEYQAGLVRRDLEPSVRASLCVAPVGGGVDIEVSLENLFAGHAWPSGATHARRGWVELHAYSGESEVFSSGDVADGEPAALLDDPNMWLLSNRMFDADGKEVHAPWQAHTMESTLLAPAVTRDPTDPRYYHGSKKNYFVPTIPDRITIQVNFRPVGLEIIDDLIAGGLLDEAIRDRVPTFRLTPTMKEWTTAEGFGCVE